MVSADQIGCPLMTGVPVVGGRPSNSKVYLSGVMATAGYISSSSFSTGRQNFSSTTSASYWRANSRACLRRTSASPLSYSSYACS